MEGREEEDASDYCSSEGRWLAVRWRYPGVGAMQYAPTVCCCCWLVVDGTTRCTAVLPMAAGSGVDVGPAGPPAGCGGHDFGTSAG